MTLLTPEYSLLIWMLLSLGVVGLWVFALVHILRSRFREHNNKLIWTLLVVLLPVIGSLLYLFIGRKQTVTSNTF